MHARDRLRAVLSGCGGARGRASQDLREFDFRCVVFVPSRTERRSRSPAREVNAVQGRPTEMEVMVQGKQVKAVTDLLMNKGVPKKWIETADATEKKKK